MTQALLDHPWALASSPDDGKILLQFEVLVRNHGLDVVRFITEEEYASAWEGRKRYASAQALRFVEHLIRADHERCLAVPIPQPIELSDTWKSALRNSMGNLDDWRSPQIIISGIRRNDWPQGHKVLIQFASCEDSPESGPHERLLVQLDEYSSHPLTRADCDPWDLERIHPPANASHVTRPCRLPKPPELENMSLEDIRERMALCQQIQGENFYYLPRLDWSPQEISKESWRDRGHAFPYKSDPRPHQSGWVDRDENTWSWDETHGRHWDVQMTSGDYVKISHTGARI
jgi:hypothetical protein